MEERLKKVFADLFGVGMGEVNDGMSIETMPSWDSLRMVQIVASIEEIFDISPLTVDEIVSMTSFGKIKEVLRKKLKGRD